MPFHGSTVHIKSKAKKQTPKPRPRPKRGRRASLSEEKRMSQGERKSKPSQALRGGAGGLSRISDALK